MELSQKLCKIRAELKHIREETSRLVHVNEEEEKLQNTKGSEHGHGYYAQPSTQLMGNQLTRTIYNEVPYSLVCAEKPLSAAIDQNQSEEKSVHQELDETRKEVERLIVINRELERMLNRESSEKISLFLKISEYKKCLQRCTCQNLF